MMTINDIKSAVDSGATVHWANDGYTVTKDTCGQYFIQHDNGSSVGLTGISGHRLNGDRRLFYVAASRGV